MTEQGKQNQRSVSNPYGDQKTLNTQNVKKSMKNSNSVHVNERLTNAHRGSTAMGETRNQKIQGMYQNPKSYNFPKPFEYNDGYYRPKTQMGKTKYNSAEKISAESIQTQASFFKQNRGQSKNERRTRQINTTDLKNTRNSDLDYFQNEYLGQANKSAASVP